jgi:hypothetical protein
MSEIPKTLASEIGDALNALIHESDKCRDWNAPEIQTLVRASEKLQKIDARQAFVHLGSLAAICGEVDRLFEYFRKALLLPGEAETKHEYWTMQANAGLYGSAKEIGSWLLDPKKGFFPKAWERAVARGQILEVWGRLPDAKRTFHDLSNVDFTMLRDAVAVMEERGLRDQDIISVLGLMGETQRAHRIMFSGQLGTIVKVMRPPEDPPYLYITIPLDTSVSEIHAMNRELARLVVEKLPDGAFPQGLIASFTKAHPVELLAAA